MIYVFNETPNEWKAFGRRNNSVDYIRKSHYENSSMNQFTVTQADLYVNRRVKLVEENPVALNKILKSSVNMYPSSSKDAAQYTASVCHPVALTAQGQSTFVSYSDFTFNPIALSSDRADEPFLLLSLRKHKDSRVRNKLQGVEILETYAQEGEYTAVLRFRDESEITFIVEKSNKKLYAYKITYSHKTGLRMTSKEVDGEAIKGIKHSPRQFRPFILSKLLITHADNFDKAKKVRNSPRYKRSKSHIETIEHHTVINTAAFKKTTAAYKVVTFVHGTDSKVKVSKDTERILRYLKNNFAVVQEVFTDLVIKRG